MKALISIVVMAAALAGCAGQGLVEETPSEYLAARALVATPEPARFSFCLDHGCARVETAALNQASWASVTAELAEGFSSAAAERAALANVVARFEQATRARLRIGRDIAGTYPGALASDQNDCVDETANTTTLLLMLKDAGLLRRHDVGPPARRGAFVDIALPHRSATIIDRQTGAAYVLDSWFRDSGAPADIAPLEDWLNGWTPEGGAWS